MKTKLPHLFILLALLAIVRSAPAQVTNLGIAPAGGQSILYWPTSTTTNFVLQTTATLSSPNWVTASNAVTVDAALVTNAAPAGYFRLRTSPIQAGMALISAGSFTMGDTLDGISDAIATNIYVSAFYIDINLVSLSQWTNVSGYGTSHGYTFADSGSGNGANYPVETVQWFDGVAWCNARSAQASLVPVYYSDAGLTQVYVNANGTNVFMNMTNSGYRLPTEAEWEKAARGGLTGSRFPWGNLIGESQASYNGGTAYSYDLGPNGYNSVGTSSGSPPYTTSVGIFAANGYGLYDMAGNVNQWCWDWYGTPYGQPTTVNPTGPASGSARVFRGGYWGNFSYGARTAQRGEGAPSSANSSIGLRCVKGF